MLFSRRSSVKRQKARLFTLRKNRLPQLRQTVEIIQIEIEKSLLVQLFVDSFFVST
jgi:hypothetical protein